MDKSERKPPSKADYAAVVASAAILIIVLLWGIQSGNPYGYYVFLRMVVSAGAFVFFSIFSGEKRKTLVVLFVAVAILYNPFFPVHLTREKWIVFNVATIAAFGIGFALWRVGLRQRRTSND